MVTGQVPGRVATAHGAGRTCCVLQGCLSPARCVTAPWEQPRAGGAGAELGGAEGRPGRVAVQGPILGVLPVMLPHGSFRRVKYGALRGVYPELLKGLSEVFREPTWVQAEPLLQTHRGVALGTGRLTAPFVASAAPGQVGGLLSVPSGFSPPRHSPASPGRGAPGRPAERPTQGSPHGWDPWT